MLPQDRRAVVLSYDEAVDSLAVKLYRAADARRRAALRREVDAMRETLGRLVAHHVIAPGDLRR
jgi:hypothetical protein